MRIGLLLVECHVSHCRFARLRFSAIRPRKSDSRHDNGECLSVWTQRQKKTEPETEPGTESETEEDSAKGTEDGADDPPPALGARSAPVTQNSKLKIEN
jgi:hypothetical protein